MKILQKCRTVARFKGSGGPKIGYFGYFCPSKMGSKIRSTFGSIFDRIWVDFGSHFGTNIEHKWDQKMIKNQDGKKKRKRRAKMPRPSLGNAFPGGFGAPGGG